MGSFTSYTGGAVLGNSVVSLGGIGVNLLNETERLVNSTIPNTQAWFNTLKTTVYIAVDSFSSRVSSEKLTIDGVIPALNNLSSTMKFAGEGAQSLIDSGNNISSLNAIALSLATQMITGIKKKLLLLIIPIDISTIQSNLTTWNLPISISSGGTYSVSVVPVLTAITNILADNVKYNLNNASVVTSYLANITLTPSSCLACAVLVKSSSDDLPSSVKQRVSDKAVSVKSNLDAQLEKTKANIINSLSSMRDSANKNAGQGKNSLNSFSSEASIYNNIRNNIMIIMSTIILVILAVFSYFGYRQKPKSIKGCNLVSTPIYVVIQLLAVVLFILSIMIGDVCSSVFDISPAPVLNGLPSGGLYDGVSTILMLRDQCSANYSILTIAVNTNLISAESIDTTQLCNNAIDAVDFSPLGNIDLSSLVVFSPDPATILTPLKNLNLSNLNAASLDILVNYTLPALKSNLTSLFLAINSTFVQSSQANISSADADFLSRKTSLNNIIEKYISTNGIIDTISGYGSSMSAKMVALPGQLANINVILFYCLSNTLDIGRFI